MGTNQKQLKVLFFSDSITIILSTLLSTLTYPSSKWKYILRNYFGGTKRIFLELPWRTNVLPQYAFEFAFKMVVHSQAFFTPLVSKDKRIIPAVYIENKTLAHNKRFDCCQQPAKFIASVNLKISRFVCVFFSFGLAKNRILFLSIFSIVETDSYQFEKVQVSIPVYHPLHRSIARNWIAGRVFPAGFDAGTDETVQHPLRNQGEW